MDKKHSDHTFEMTRVISCWKFPFLSHRRAPRIISKVDLRSVIQRRRPKGSSTLEILIAFVILTLVMTAVIEVVFGNQTIGIDTQTNTEALYKAQALLESERALARQNWGAVASVSPSADGIYTKSVDVQSIDSITKRVIANVLWNTTGRNLSVHLTTLLTDFVSAGNICSENLTGDWKNPIHYDYATVDLISPVTSNHTTGFGISDVKAYRKKLYLAADSTADAKNTFYIFDLPNDPSQMPVYRGELSNAPSATTPVINGILLAQNYAFIANGTNANFGTCAQSDKCSQFQVVDVSNSAAPSLTKSLKVPGVVGSGGQGIGWSIQYDGGYVYLGLKTGGGHEFNIYDVGGGGAPASAANPVFKGSYNVGFTVNSIFIKGMYAYLATNDNMSNNKQLLVLDISDKTNPHLTTAPVGGFFKTPGIGFGYDVEAVGNKIYLGRTFAGSSVPNFYILDGINPASYPTSYPVLGSKVVGTNDSVNALMVHGYLSFLLSNNQFQLWNISDPTNIIPWSSDGTQNTFLSLTAIGGIGTAFDCSGNYFYAAVQSPTANKDILSVIASS